MLSNVDDVRAWLMKRPHPVKVRAEMGSGEERVVRIGESRSRWRDASEALAGAVRCEALDGDAEILRVWESENSLDHVPGLKQAKSELAEFARLLADSNDKAVQRNAEVFRMAFDQQALLTNLISQRLAALEKAWHSLLMQQEQLAAERASDADPNAGLVGSLVGALGAAQQAAANGSKS